MAHKVICYYCKQIFDRDKEEFVKVSDRRYAHKKCAEQQDAAATQIEKDKAAFWACVKEIFGAKYNYVMINQQAQNFIEKYNYTWSGMTKSLQWFFNIKHGSKEDGNGGIGIIPYVYDKAKEYYYAIYLAELNNKEKKITRPVVDICIQSPRAWQRPPRLLDLGGENINE